MESLGTFCRGFFSHALVPSAPHKFTKLPSRHPSSETNSVGVCSPCTHVYRSFSNVSTNGSRLDTCRASDTRYAFGNDQGLSTAISTALSHESNTNGMDHWRNASRLCQLSVDMGWVTRRGNGHFLLPATIPGMQQNYDLFTSPPAQCQRMRQFKK